MLDIGSGPGYLLASIADPVGAQGTVHGLDPSAPIYALAATRTSGRPQVQVDVGDTVGMPYADGSFDAAVATQVYEYVADVPRALAELRRVLAELRRVLRTGGRALILDTDWDSLVWHAANRALHDRVIAAWEEHLVHPHLPHTLAGLLRRAGFEITTARVVVLFNRGPGL